MIKTYKRKYIQLFADDFHISSKSAYTENGGTFTVGYKLNLSGGTNVFTNYLSRNYTTGFEKWISKVKFKINTIGYGFGITIKSPVLDFTIKLCCDSTNSGKIKIYGYGTNLHATSTDNATLNTDDYFEFKIIRNFNEFICQVTNLTTLVRWEYTWTSDVTVSSAVSSLPKIGKPTITNFGGDIDIFRWEFLTQEYANCNLAIIGDSITQCYFASEIENRYASKVTNRRKAILGCGGDTTALFLTRITDIYYIRPKNVLVFLGANESNTTTFNTNYRTIIDAFVAKGYNINLCSCIPKNSSNRTAYNTVISNICTDYDLNYIDIYNPLLGSGYAMNAAYDSGDGVHPNDAGHDLIASTINSNIVLL